WRGGVIENKELDVIWPVGMRGTEDRPFTFPQGTTPAKRAETFRDVIREQVAMTKELVPKDKAPLFHFTMYNEMLPAYQANPAAFDLPEDVMIIWPDDNDGHMRGLPSGLGKWKHGVYYHLAYLGGRLSKQLTHVVNPKTVAEQFDKIVKSGATEYMLVNVSELRDYVMTARMVADITWDAASHSADEYTNWWAREYFGVRTTAVADAYRKYFTLLDSPDKFWIAPDAVEDLVDALYKKVAGESYAPFPAEKLSLLKSRDSQLGAAFSEATVARSLSSLTRSQSLFYDTDVLLGLTVAERQTAAALDLEEALRASDTEQMWSRVFSAFGDLEIVEDTLRASEYPPFDRWYQESWIRSALSFNNPHRPHNQVRAFIGNEGHGKLVRMGQR
ncbi:MAG TPA: glycosyl hydrolase 115 family protein, partial [Candidatus Solibacter sp.]|nr:glycosyl hydrolase 115 family protein [Candidatus Solibacter sp.]